MNEQFRNDPVLWLLPDDVPAAFLRLSPDEQAWRGRMFLMTWILAGQHIQYAWWAAMNDDPLRPGVEKAAVLQADDRLIIEGVRIAKEEMALSHRGEDLSTQ